MQQRLISTLQVAKKLGYKSTTGFTHALQKLHKQGLPQPVITGAGLSRKWDERAIDAWLDHRMEPSLQATITIQPVEQISIERTLADRASRIGKRSTHA